MICMLSVIVFDLRNENPKFHGKADWREAALKYKILINNLFKMCKILFTEMQTFI